MHRFFHSSSFPKFLIAWFLVLVTSSTARARIDHVILISVDGLRGDFVETLMNTVPEEVPNFVRMRNVGASTCNARCDYTKSITEPNHVCMITGRPAAGVAGQPSTVAHGFLSSEGAFGTIHALGNPEVPYKASVFDVVHDAGLSTAAYLGKTSLNLLLRSYDELNGAQDLLGPDNGRNKLDFAGYFGNPVTDPASEFISAIHSGNLRNFTLVHVTDTDLSGHAFGWSIAPGSQHRLSIQAVDAKLGGILDAIAIHPMYAGHTAIILTADHGGGGGATENRSHSDPSALGNITIPMFLVAPGLPGGVNLYAWVADRFDPGSERLDYAAPAQPLRNGDTGNLAMALLGLSPIPGSALRPVLKRQLKVEYDAHAGATLTWPLYLGDQTLEKSDGLDGWDPITAGITESATEFRFRDGLPLPPARFYRLRAP